MKKLIPILMLMLAGPVFAQSVSPLVVECSMHCKGSFTVSNSGIKPMSVVIEPLSFSLSPDGKSIFRTLDAGVQVTLDETSARLGPMDSHEFDYELKCGAPPCLVALRAGMVVGHVNNGVVLRLIIPHVVYMDTKAAGARERARRAAGLKD